MRYLKEIGYWILVLGLLYVSVANFVFQYRNPKSNETSIFRQPLDVVTFQVLPDYQ